LAFKGFFFAGFVLSVAGRELVREKSGTNQTLLNRH